LAEGEFFSSTGKEGSIKGAEKVWGGGRQVASSGGSLMRLPMKDRSPPMRRARFPTAAIVAFTAMLLCLLALGLGTANAATTDTGPLAAAVAGGLGDYTLASAEFADPGGISAPRATTTTASDFDEITAGAAYIDVGVTRSGAGGQYLTTATFADETGDTTAATTPIGETSIPAAVIIAAFAVAIVVFLVARTRNNIALFGGGGSVAHPARGSIQTFGTSGHDETSSDTTQTGFNVIGALGTIVLHIRSGTIGRQIRRLQIGLKPTGP